MKMAEYKLKQLFVAPMTALEARTILDQYYYHSRDDFWFTEPNAMWCDGKGFAISIGGASDPEVEFSINNADDSWKTLLKLRR